MANIAQLLTEHMDIWTAADTEKKSGRGRSSDKTGSVYGVKKLRELILELAVRGKLVPQEPDDEPASELLKRIKAEKAKLNEQPFELPKSWEWVYFGQIAQHNSGKTLDKGRNKGILRDYITTSNLYWGTFELNTIKQMPIEESELERCTAQKGDLLICEGGEAGRAAVWSLDKEVCFQNHIHRARMYGNISSFYAYRYFEKLNATGEIEQYRKGVGISNMSGKALASVLFALPPLAEQHRIITKVDELMALCDQLEQQHSNVQQAHEILVSQLLATLIQSQNAAEFNINWQRIYAYFDLLFTTESSIDAFKQTLLQVAVMGKLIPQDPKDEPARELLKRIQAEKVKLMAKGKLRKEKPLVPISEDEKPFEIPNSWEWVRLKTIATKITDGTHYTPKYLNGGVPFLSVKDMSSGKLDFSSTRFISEAEHNELFKRCNPEYGDLLLTKVGTTGIAVVVNVKQPFSIFVSVALIKSVWDLINVNYLKLLISAPLVKKQSEEGTEGIGNKNLVLRKIEEFVLVLPPLAEQHRIVAKVDELMVLCDQLKTLTQQSNQKQQVIANTLVALATSS